MLVDARLTKEIDLKISRFEVNLHKPTPQTRWIIAGLATLGAIFKLADPLIP